MLENKVICRYLEMLVTAFGDEIVHFLNDREVIEVMLNPDGKLWVESYDKGKYFTGIILETQRSANIVKLVASYHQLIVDEEHPEVACEIPLGLARFQGWLPPVVSAPSFTIRKRATKIYTLEDYLANGSITEKQVTQLKDAVKMRKNILIAGGTSSGKTTFANALLYELRDSSDRMVILEDLPELQIQSQDYVKLAATIHVTMRMLVKGVLRMRPDRIIIGEVRDGAALDLLKAWNTGHPGGICTIHANSPEATISRLEDLVREAAANVPNYLIKEALDVIVFMQRNRSGKYSVESVTELTEY